MNSATLKVVIGGDARGAAKALKSVRDDTKKTGFSIKDLGKLAAGGIAAGAAVAVGVAAASVKAAIEDQKSASILRNTLQKTTGATKAQVSAVEDWIDKTQRATGIADDELRPALGTLLRATKDTAKAQDILTTAMDVATATGKPLSAVSTALAKAYQGNTGALGKLGIQTKDASGKALSFAKVMEQMKAKMGGSTAAAANTLEGKMKRANIAFSEVKEQIGYKLIPILTALATVMIDDVIPAIEKTVNWISVHWPPVQKVIVDTVRAIANVVQTVLGGIEHFWKAWGGRIKSFTSGLFGGIKTYIQGTLNVIRGIIKVITSLIHGDWSGAWNGIKQIIFGVWQEIKGIVRTAATIVTTTLSVAWALVRNKVHEVWDGILNFLGGLPRRAGSVAYSIAAAIAAPFRTVWNAVADAWNNTVGKFGIHTHIPWPINKDINFDVPDLPHFHSGGVFNSGRGEGVALLRDGEGIFTPAQMRALGAGAGGPSGTTIINLPAGAGASQVAAAQTRWNRRNGRR